MPRTKYRTQDGEDTYNSGQSLAEDEDYVTKDDSIPDDWRNIRKHVKGLAVKRDGLLLSPNQIRRRTDSRTGP